MLHWWWKHLIGAIHEFLDDKEVELYGVEAEGSAALTYGSVGIMQGFKSFMLQEVDGSATKILQISFGINFYSAGPEHAYLKSIGRVKYVYETDEEAFETFKLLCRTEVFCLLLNPPFQQVMQLSLLKKCQKMK